LETSGPIGSDLAAEVVRRFGTLRLRVTGGSMAPGVRPGDTLVVQSCGLGEVSAGEIVVYRRTGRLVVHRVTGYAMQSGERHLLTRGDRARGIDLPVSSMEFLGRVCSLHRDTMTVPAATDRNLIERMISWILSYSNRATSLYLWFAPR
jgi:signal peptidase I